jgi:hypothetical protein
VTNGRRGRGQNLYLAGEAPSQIPARYFLGSPYDKGEGGVGGKGGRPRLDCADLGHGRTVDHIFYPLSPGCAWPISGRQFYLFLNK